MRNAPPGLLVVVQVVGLMATGWLVWSQSILPRLAFLSPHWLLVEAFGYALLACGASAVITTVLCVAGWCLWLARRACSIRNGAWDCRARHVSRAQCAAAAPLLRPQSQSAVAFVHQPESPHATLTEFNEIAVVYHFDQIRNDRGARMAIEKFVLIPRS